MITCIWQFSLLSPAAKRGLYATVMVGVDYDSLQADSQPKTSGLVLGRRPLGAVLHSSSEPGKLSQWLCRDDSTINIVLELLLLYYCYYYYMMCTDDIFFDDCEIDAAVSVMRHESQRI